MAHALTTSPNLLQWEAIPPGKAVSPADILPLARAAVAAAPENAELKVQLARTLFAADRLTELLDWLRPMMQHDDIHPELLYQFGRAALLSGDNQAAASVLRRAADRGFRQALALLAEALAGLKRNDECIDVAIDALKSPSEDFRPLSLLASILPGRGETRRLWQLCLDLRARDYWGGYLPAVTAFAAASLGYDDELELLINPARWFAATQIGVPPGFNQDLSAELLGNRFLAPVHSTKATRGSGSWIERLDVRGGASVKELFARIQTAVESYVAERLRYADDPMVRFRPSSTRVDSWATLVHDDGYQKWHVHPAGWISGVYYVDVPDLEGAGDIEFGLLPFGNRIAEFRAPSWRVRPRPGLLLLFPSYYAHRTWPTEVNDVRISIAFDVTPTGPRQPSQHSGSTGHDTSGI